MQAEGARIDQAVSAVFLEAVAPAGLQASLQTEEMIEAEQDRPMAEWRWQVEQARYQAERAERRYRSVEPENRLVARTLEAAGEERLDELTTAAGELTRREHQRPPQLADEQREGIHRLGVDLNRAWETPATMDRDRQELLRALLETVDLLRRLAAYYPDDTIAGIFNRQGKKTAYGLGFTASRVGSLRHHMIEATKILRVFLTPLHQKECSMKMSPRNL
jgi:uncharacterized protein YndB with AHSA1/START domain